MRDLMFAAVWVVLLPLSMMAAHVGVLLWVWVALLSPNELLTGFMAGVPFNKVVAIITLGVVFLTKDKKDLYFDASLALLLLLALSATISWQNSIVPSPDGTELYEKLLKEIVLAVTITAVMSTRHRIHLLVLVIALSLGFLGVKEGLISLLTAGGHQIVGAGSIGDNNALATALLMIIPLIYYLIRRSAVIAVKLGLAAALGLSLVTILMTFSRGGFVGMLVLGFFMIKNSRNKITSIGLVVLAGALVYFLAPEAWFERLSTIESADNDSSFLGRVVAWKISLLIAMDNPFFGGGMHAVQRLPVWNAYKPLLGLVNFMTTPPADDTPHAAHSIYFEVLGDLGFVGLTLFLALLGMAFRNCRRIYRLSKAHASLAWAADLARMLEISLIIYVVTAAALSMAYFELIYILIAMTSRCHRTVRLTLAAETAGTGQTSVDTAEVVLPKHRRPAPAGWRGQQAGQLRPAGRG